MGIVKVWHKDKSIHTYEKVGCMLYNGYTLEEVKQRTSFLGSFQKNYIENVVRVIDCQMSGLNLHEIDSCKNYNFELIKWFMNNKK